MDRERETDKTERKEWGYKRAVKTAANQDKLRHSYSHHFKLLVNNDM